MKSKIESSAFQKLSTRNYCTNVKYNKIFWEVWVECYGVSDEGRKSLLWKFQLKEVKCLWTLEQLLLLISQLCPTLCNPVDCSVPGFPVLALSLGVCSDSCTLSQWCHPTISPLLLLPLIFPCIRVFSNKSAIHIQWPKYWSFSFSISPSMNIQDWFL